MRLPPWLRRLVRECCRRAEAHPAHGVARLQLLDVRWSHS
ncbi:hypothetical protein STAFG_6352 [Streptomyces afghaniensis 772]|uniref:Uncharacterized protein n=1 Tax=Streptomyces afghaniensis 772 TaxID=1283301 RepID=S4MLX5_9ACTN|nr:hypothetical protein STAFG_6352 [Streptomyces afghaniensis 772]